MFKSIKPLLPSYSLPFFHRRPWPRVNWHWHTHTPHPTPDPPHPLQVCHLALGKKKTNPTASLKVHSQAGEVCNEISFARYFYHRLGGTNRKELVSWRVTPPLGFTDQSQTNSFSNLNIYIYPGKVHLCMPWTEAAATTICRHLVWSYDHRVLHFPRETPTPPLSPREPGGPSRLWVPRGRPRTKAAGPQREGRAAGVQSTRAPVHDPVIPRKNGTFRFFRPRRSGGGNPSIRSRKSDAGAAAGIPDARSCVTGIAADWNPAPSPSGYRLANILARQVSLEPISIQSLNPGAGRG